MINVFTLTNINTKIFESKLNKIFISEVCLKLVALHINQYTRSGSQFQKGWWPLVWTKGFQPFSDHAFQQMSMDPKVSYDKKAE